MRKKKKDNRFNMVCWILIGPTADRGTDQLKPVSAGWIIIMLLTFYQAPRFPWWMECWLRSRTRSIACLILLPVAYLKRVFRRAYAVHGRRWCSCDFGWWVVSGGTRWLHKVRPCIEDASCVKQLRSCGAILVGKTNMHELGAGASGINPHYG